MPIGFRLITAAAFGFREGGLESIPVALDLDADFDGAIGLAQDGFDGLHDLTFGAEEFGVNHEAQTNQDLSPDDAA